MIESGFALVVAFLINVSVIAVSGTVCNSSNLSKDNVKSCQDLSLNRAAFLLKVCVCSVVWWFTIPLFGESRTYDLHLMTDYLVL